MYIYTYETGMGKGFYGTSVKMCAMQISQSCPTLFDNMFANYKSFGLLKIKFCII